MGVRPRPRIDVALSDRSAVRPLHRREVRRAEVRDVVRDDQPRDRAEAGRRRRGGGGRRRRRRPRRVAGVRKSLAEDAGQGARQVRLPPRQDAPGEGARVRRPRDDGRREADQGVARRRRASRLGALFLLRGVGRQARLRPAGPEGPAARRLRAGDPLELPPPDGGLEAGPGARGGEHLRPEARRDDAAHGAPPRPARSGGGLSSRRRERRHGGGRDRGGARRAPGRREGRVHRLDRGREADSALARRDGQEADARARRQGREHRLRRRADRPGGRGDRRRHLLQPGACLLRRLAPPRGGIGPRPRREEARAPDPDSPARRPAGQEHRRRRHQLEGAA